MGLLADTAFDQLCKVRDRVIARIRQVNKTTEDDILAAGRHVHKVVGVARGHIARLREVLAGPVGNEDSDLARAIRTQSDHVRSHTTSVGRAVTDQAAQVSAVAEQARAISTAAREVERLNAAARVLSINARIEASRSHGSAVFGTIASEMQQLSNAIASANKKIYDLSTAMRESVPELVRQNHALARIVEAYANEARDKIDNVDRRVAELRSAVSYSLSESDHALAEIVNESHAALSKMQFQDVCAQSLLQIDGWIAEVSQQVADEMGIDAEIEIPEAAHRTLGNDDVNVDHGSAGEVMLF